MKKGLIMVGLLLSCLAFNCVSAEELGKAKVQTNYQYKLTCGYWDNSDKLTWGSKSFIGSYSNEDGTESNDSRACGQSQATKDYPIGDSQNSNRPLQSKVVYDTCNGTASQQAKVGTSCNKKGEVRTCAIKWSGYCYKNTNSVLADNTVNFSVEKTSLEETTETKVINSKVCSKIVSTDRNIITYDEKTDKIRAIGTGSAYLECYSQDEELLSSKKITVIKKQEPKPAAVSNYRYVNTGSNIYGDYLSKKVLARTNQCDKVIYLDVKVMGMCKISDNGTVGYVFCEYLNLENPKACK